MRWTQIVLAAALAIYLGAFFAVLAAVRCSTGVSPVGRTGGHRPAAVLNGVATLLLLLTAGAHILDARSVGWFGRIALLDHAIMRGLGAVMLVFAGVYIVWGEISLGRSFRVALPESKQALVTHGVYGFTRNPLALSADLLALGVLLLAPSCVALMSVALNVVSYECKIRIEEAYLREAHGAAYEAYSARTGRYLPQFLNRR